MELDIFSKLDFSPIDLTTPNRVVEEVLAQLPENTQNIVFGAVSEYTGHVTSYTVRKAPFAETIGAIAGEKYVDIQHSLGKQGDEEKKYECYLYTSSYTKYKYRLFFMRYGTAVYPVQFTLDEEIARSIQATGSNYFVTCNNRNEVENLLSRILRSEKVRGVMQELIRIYQSKKSDGFVEEVVDESVDTE